MIPTINKDTVEKYFTRALIVVLAIIVLFETCSSGHNIKPKETVTTKIDTFWQRKIDTVTKKETVYKTLPGKITKEYIPSKNCDSLKEQYIFLRDKFLAKNIYKDTLKLDQLGNIQITDSIYQNKIQKRIFIKDICILTIEKTVTITKDAEPVRQVYIGGNLFTDAGRSTIIIPSLIYKDKKDRVYQIHYGIDNKGNIYYGGGIFWKIKLHK